MKIACFIVTLTTTLSIQCGHLWAGVLSPAEQKIEAAQHAIEKHPTRVDLYNRLALSLALRARETANVAYYEEAQKVLEKSFLLSKDNFEAEKIHVWILLGKHEFLKALKLAKKLYRRAPDDLQVAAFLVDSNVELGRYEEAEKSAQRLLDQQPGHIPGLTRAAYLRELFGDNEGAIELMWKAYQGTPSSETEERSWILTQIGHLNLMTGQIQKAETLLLQALQIFPDYHYALAELSKIRTAQQKYEQAVELLRRRFLIAPHPENLYDVGKALERMGSSQEAEALLLQFEKAARIEMDKGDNANRHLIFYYADSAGKPGQALRIAQREVRRRRDVYTLDAYAWALYATGNYKSSYRVIRRALAVGTRDPQLFYHAGLIAHKADQWTEAVHYLKECLETNPHSEFSGDAQKMLHFLHAIQA